MGDTSLVGIIDLMTGEKDPRNLMLVFSILKVVMIEWDISNHAEVCRSSLQIPSSTANVRRLFLKPLIITSRLPSDLLQTIHTGLRRKT
jgi:hypothetical protein